MSNQLSKSMKRTSALVLMALAQLSSSAFAQVHPEAEDFTPKVEAYPIFAEQPAAPAQAPAPAQPTVRTPPRPPGPLDPKPYRVGDISWITGNHEVFAEAMKITKTLPRTVIVYHWVPRKYLKFIPKDGVVDTTKPEIIKATEENIVSRMERFWDVSLEVSGRSQSGGAQAPNGFYVATEPLISERFGDTLYQMQMPAGMRYIDARYDVKIGPKLIAAMEERGCILSDTTTRTLSKADTEETACRQALIDITAATGSAAIGYIFQTEPVKYCNKVIVENFKREKNRTLKEAHATAFVLTSPSSIEEGSIKVLLRKSFSATDGLNHERSIINGIFQEDGPKGQTQQTKRQKRCWYSYYYGQQCEWENVTVSVPNSTPQLPFPDVAAADKATVEKYMNDNFYSCNLDMKKFE